MSEDLEQLKQRLPLLEYLQRRNWVGYHVGAGDESVGLCPLHPDMQPSFYIAPVSYCSLPRALRASRLQPES